MNRRIGLWLCFFCTPLVAQEQTKPLPNENDPRLAGQIYSPLFCPSNPDLVAYERQVEDIQELYLYNYRTGEIQAIRAVGEAGGKKEDPFQSLFETRQLDDFTRFEGQLDWRPVLDDKQRQWFIFVSNGGGKSFDLYLSYVDRYGRMASEPALHLAHDGVDQYPRWAPDGASLVFVSGDKSGSDLFLTNDMAELLRQNDLKLFRPVKITTNPEEDNYPAWSPDGKALAYQALWREGTLLNMGINVINVDEINNAAPRTIRVTTDLGTYHEYNPSWSAKGNYLAYYLSQARVDQESGNRLLDIGVATVIRNAKNNRIESGRVIQGTSPRLAKNVIPNRNTGPTWSSRCPDEALANNIFYVKRDEKNSNPIVSANFSKWHNRNIDYENAVATFSTRLHRDVTLTQFKLDGKEGFTRFAYVSQVRNANQLQVEETRLTGTAIPDCIPRFKPERPVITPAVTEKKPELESTKVDKAAESDLKAQKPRPPQAIRPKPPQPKSKATAVFLSTLLPGVGQMYKGQIGKGLVFTVAEAASLAALFKFRGNYFDSKSDFDAQLAQGNITQASRIRANQLKPHAQKANLALGVAAGIWALNLFDSALSSPPSVKRPGLRLDQFGVITFPETGIRYQNGAWVYTAGAKLDF
jgi:Tol biopolymer transport system component